MNNLYFKNHLSNPEFKTVVRNLDYEENILLSDVIRDSKYYTRATSNIVLVVPLFHCDYISSSNNSDKPSKDYKSIVCEYKPGTRLIFKKEGAV